MVLTINYRGRLENLMRDRLFNVLMPGGGFVDIRMANPDDPTKYLEVRREVEDALKTARQKNNEPDIKKYERYRAIFFANAKQFMYNGILDRLHQRNMIWRWPVDRQKFEMFSRWQDSTYAHSLPDPIDPSTVTPPTAPTGDASDTRIAHQKTRPPADSDFDPNTELVSYLESDEFRNRLSSGAGSTHNIDYVFLGDLIGAVVSNTIGDELDFGSAHGAGLATFKIETPSTMRKGKGPRYANSSTKVDIIDKFRVVLGNINISPPRSSGVQPINLAHIPISLESFQDFMVKNVLSKNILFYSLFDFLNDLVSDLVTHMFSAGCFGGMLSVKSRVGSSIVTSPKKLKGHVYITDPDRGYKVVDVAKSTPKAPAFELCVRDEISQSMPHQYLVLNVLDTFPRGLAGTLDPAPGPPPKGRGDSIGDRERGIMHFTYGMDRGLLKSAEFSKTNQEYLPEARFVAEGDFVFNQLSNVYDASFNMLGNNIFKPGMHIYFDPSPTGAGMPWQRKEDSTGKVVLRSWSNIMGLGGYHLVTEVANSIKPGKFDTTVKARWVTSGELPASTEEQEAAAAHAASGVDPATAAQLAALGIPP